MTNLEEKNETKEQILVTALELFSRFGFDGVSVRELAEASIVNIAAINYHFGSKHNLYWAVMSRSHDLLRTEIERLMQTTTTMEDLIVGVFDFVINDPALFRTSVKIMLTDGVPDPDPQYYDACCEKGPPGMEFIAQRLIEETRGNFSQKNLEWAVRAIFGVWFHWSTICCSSKMELLTKINKAPLSLNEIKTEIRLTVQAIQTFLIKKSKS